ncbi:MAG TPA: VCBS repeat-containing protein, partial [Pyrinomonadaceae bacterium]|nr:VCBS repeat-containing protein [Pyrinomonadaceae bacterium]
MTRLIVTLILFLILAGVPLTFYHHADSSTTSFPVALQAAGRGKPYLNMQDGRLMRVDYRGDNALVAALREGTAQSRALAYADLDGDAAPDLVAGYANGRSGIVTIQRGNPEGFAPKDDSVFARMQNGYNPDSLLPMVETYQVSEPVDFLHVKDFNKDGRIDVLIGSRDGSLHLLAGDGAGRLGSEIQLHLSGKVTALTAGEFRAADGQIDVAVAILGPRGPEVLVVDGAEDDFESTPYRFPLRSRAAALEFGELDSDPFMDLAIATGTEIQIVHGWGRKTSVNPELQVERIPLGYTPQGLAIDNFTWDRNGTREIAVLVEDSSVRLLEHSRSDKRPLNESELMTRAASRGRVTNRNSDVEAFEGWSRATGNWREVNNLALNAHAGANVATQPQLTHGKISSGETNALMVMNAAQRRLEVVHQVSAHEASLSFAGLKQGDLSTVSLDATGTPVAMIVLPRKLNGVRDLVMLEAERVTPISVPMEPTAVFAVNTTSDHAPDGACNASPDCTFREAVIAANASVGPDTINLPAGTYTLTIIGNTNNMGAGEGFTGNPAIGDVDFRDANGDATTVSGAGSGTTFIVQSTANDRTLEPNP